MKNIITNAAEITVLRLIDNTFKTGGGPVSIGATCLMAGKGPVMKVTQVNASNWQNIFGKPLPKKPADVLALPEGLRHLADAVNDCSYVNVVRVVPIAAKFPSSSIKTADGTVTEAAHDYGTSLSLGVGVCLQVWPIDGDPSINRKYAISDVVTDKSAWLTATAYAVNDVVTVSGGRLICIADNTSTTAPTLAAPGTDWKVYDGSFDNRLTLTFYDVDTEGTEYVLETYKVGLGVNDLDDMGRPAYIETVLEQNSDIFRCNYDESVTFASALVALKAIQTAGKKSFIGGTNGAFVDEAERVTQFKKAWDLFRNEQYLAYLMFAAGNYDADVLSNCLKIAEARHVSFFFDVNPNLTPTGAIDWLKGAGLENRQGACYYSPFSANDAFYGGKAVWGISGGAVAACAKGDANFTGATPGVHYAPAGIYRGKLTRTGLKPLNDDVINRDDFYTARINPVVASDTGGAVIDDCLSIHYKQNYSRFIWVNRIANYIDHRFVEAAAYMKFEPDGLTRNGLTKLTKQILDELVVSGALVPPRDPADGTNPYTLKVEQVEIDLWLVTWDFCPTGAARRIAGQPRLIK